MMIEAAVEQWPQATGARRQKLRAAGWLLALALAVPAFAASTNLFPVADTTLSENYPSNNFGGMAFVNSGTTQNSNYNRALFKFDIAGVVPGGSRITSARLVL